MSGFPNASNRVRSIKHVFEGEYTGPLATINEGDGLAFIHHKDKIECFPIAPACRKEFEPLDFGGGEE